MSDKLHVFHLKLPNGAEARLEGDRDFVEGGYRDIKSAAIQLLNREAMHRGLSAPLLEVQPVQPAPPAQVTPISAPVAPVASTTPREEGSAGDDKAKPKRKSVAKPDNAKNQLKKERKEQIGRIIAAKTFTDHDLTTLRSRIKALAH